MLENEYTPAAKALVETEGRRYAGLSIADKKYYHLLAEATVKAYLASQVGESA